MLKTQVPSDTARPELVQASDMDWDDFLRSNPDGHHEQSSAYARNRLHYGFRCDRVAVRAQGKIVGGVQVLSRSSPIGLLAHIQRGPLAVEGRPDILQAVVDALDGLARRNGWASIRVDTFPGQAAARAALEAGGFRVEPGWGGIDESLQIPLRGNSDAALLARMSRKSRYNVRVAQRSGVAVAEEGAAALDAFYALHLLTAEYQEFPVFPRSYYDEIWRVFGPSGRMHVWVARLNGQPVAAIINCVAGDRCFYGWGGMSRAPEHHTRKPNYLLHLTAMGLARDRGCAHYDLVGLSDFKEGLGGDETRWPAPLRKHYGIWRGLRSRLVGWAWDRSWLRRGVYRVSRRLYARMPY